MARLWTQLTEDARELSRVAGRGRLPTSVPRAVTRTDAFRILALERVRERARHLGLEPISHLLRVVETVLFGIEIDRDVVLGAGISFVHPVGIVIGGDARIGDRVTFFGCNTIGTAKDDGYPTIEDDVVIGAGARILGRVTVGRGAVIGANAVVLHDVPPGITVVGAPAHDIHGADHV